MAEAADFIAKLEGRYRNIDIDWEGLLEANYLTLLEGTPALNVIDVGGHAGRHSRVILERLRPANLLIFEPLPDQFRHLREMFAASPNVSVRNNALGRQPGRSTFFVKRDAPEESGLRQRSFYNDGKTSDLVNIEVEVSALDHLDLPFRIDFIKIDTEGGEIDILEGGRTLLQRDRPIVSVEYGPGGYDAYGHTAETLFVLAAEVGYVPFDLFGNRIGSLDEWRSCVGRFYWDFLLIPVARLEDLRDRIAIVRARSRERLGLVAAPDSMD